MRTLAALSLAAGIGLAAALASIVDAILLRPLPVPHPEQISRLFTASESQPLGFVSYPDFEDFRQTTPMVAECLIPVSVGEPPQIKLALAVTEDYFQILGVGARTFSGEEAILAHGTPADIGRTERIAGKPYTIIGVAPENFSLDRFLHPDLFIPIHSYGDGKILQDRSRRFLTVHLRGSGSELPAIAERLEREHPESNRGRRAVVLNEMTARLRTDKLMPPLAGLLTALALLILAIAIGNACGALLMRAESRTCETAIKLALGASPARLLAESLHEAAAISFVSSALALPLAWIVKEALRKSVVLPTDFAIDIAARIDGRITLLALAAAFAATILCGIAPHGVRVNVWSTLKSHERSAKSLTRNTVTTIEIALAAALVATGASLWTGLRAAQTTDLGYHPGHISVMTFDPSQIGYTEPRTRAFYRALLDQVKFLPGVQRVALAQSVPLGMTGAQRQIKIGDREEMTLWMNIVTPGYFELMHIAFVQGSTFDGRGNEVIVNEELAKRIGPGEKIRITGKPMELVGIVKTAKYMRWDEPPRPFFYLPYQENFASRMTLHIESCTGPIEAVGNLSREIPASGTRTLREYFDNGAMFAIKASLRIAAIAGAAGLLLALAGLYGVVSSSVERRRREIAIRVALGAPHATVFRMIVRHGMTLAALGTSAGLLAAHFTAHLLPASGPASYWAGLPILIAALAACSIPAARVLRADPAAVLRED